MSLLHWWPLNGTLEDYGLNGTPLVNNSAALSDNGKFGKCYQCNGTNTFLRTTKPCYEEYTSGQTVTFMCWVKPLTYPSTNGSGIIANNLYLSEAIGSYKGGGFGVCYTTNGQIRIFFNQITAEQSYVIATALPLNTWSHLTISYSNKNAKTYLNGILINDHDFSNDWEISGSVMKIGCGTQGGWNGYGGDKLINDVRIYDNALSQKEVAEIAKGLVVHFPFNDPYYEKVTNLASSSRYASYDYSSATVATWASNLVGYKYYGNKQFTYRAYIKNTSDHPLAVRFNPYNSDGSDYSAFNGNYIQPGAEGYSTVTKDISDTSLWNGYAILYIQNGNAGTVPENNTFYVKELQLEENDHATPFTKSSRNETIMQNSSFPSLPGNISGTIKILNDSTVGNYVNLLNGYIYMTYPITDNVFTYSLWVYENDWAQDDNWNIISAGNQLLYRDHNAAPEVWTFSFGKYIRVLDRSHGKTGWNHIGIVVTTSDVKVYINGALYSTTAVTASVSSGTMYIGNSNKNIKISDFRIYATALTADQVKQLAQTKAQIDDFGNSYSNCLKETQLHNMFESLNESLLTKTYVTGLSSYTQANCQVTFTDDGYRIYRPANHDGSTSRDTWGGLKIDNSENRFNLQEGHTYILKLHVKGKSSNANIIGWTNNMGWGDGGLEPSPTNSSAVSIPSNFNGEMDCFYKWTLSDSLYKVCTSSYSGFVQGNTYLSYKHFQFRYDYTQTGELGTDIYITNFRLYDITNISDKINIQEASILKCQDLMENLNNKTKFTQSKTIITNEFKEA